MKNFILLLILTTMLSSPVISKDARQIAKERLSKFTAEDFIKHQQPRILAPEKLNQMNKIAEKYNLIPKTEKLQSKQFDLPTDFSTPGEFEESEAVLISWPSYAYDKDGNWCESFTPGVGLVYDDFGNADTVEIAGYVMDLDEFSPYSELWANLTNAIQQECTVWIRFADAADTNNLKLFMLSKGYTLKNYKFIIDEDGENAFWMRDFGPFGIYYGNQDSVAWIKAEYYPFRVIDNSFPAKLADKLGLPVHISQLETEGGNFMTDGHGQAFYSNVVYYNNADKMGMGLTEKQPWTSTQVDNEFTKIFNLNKSTVLNMLSCDGGTGHIDLYLKMIDDQNIIAVEYPSAFNNAYFPDYQKSKNNIAKIQAQNNSFGVPYKIKKVTTPTLNNGTYGNADCTTWNNDARTYVNGLTVNKTFIMPIYSNASTGNKKADSIAIEAVKNLMPGYKIAPIDSRVLSPLGGEIHCITMQIPSFNPIRFEHKQMTGKMNYDNGLNRIGLITNKSGIKSAKFMWKLHGTTTWNSYEIYQGDVSFFCDSIASLVDKGEFDYYLEATSFNGKTQTYPITAPEGYITGELLSPSSVADIEYLELNISPNPAINTLNLEGDALISGSKIIIIDMMGNQIDLGTININNNSLNIDITALQNGVYTLVLNNNGKIKTSKFIKMN